MCTTGRCVIFGANAAFVVSLFLGLLLNGTLRDWGLTHWIDSRVTHANGAQSFSGSLPILHAEPWQFSFLDMPPLTNRTAIVTGAATGLGYYSALHLARHGARVILACRTEERCQWAAGNVTWNLTNKTSRPPPVPGGSAVPMHLNLSSLASVRDFARAVAADGDGTVDQLILNAGMTVNNYELSPDGIEHQWAYNHVGHHLLFNLLTPQLIAAAESHGHATVTAVSSHSHYLAEKLPLSLAAVNNESGYTPFGRNADTNLANVLFAIGAQRRMVGRAVHVNSVHPGIVGFDFANSFRGQLNASLGPDLAEGAVRLLRLALYGVGWSQEHGALTQLFASCSPAIVEKDFRGRYFHPVGRPMPPSSLATEEAAEALWVFTEELLSQRAP